MGPGFTRPATDSADDVAAADSRNLGHGIGLSIETLFNGDYPEAVRSSRPTFTTEQKELLKGLSLNLVCLFQ